MNMIHPDHINNEVEKTLQSLDGLQRAQANPFLYTRIRAKLEQRENSSWEKVFSFVNRPVVALAILFTVILVNSLIVFNNKKQDAATVANTEIRNWSDMNHEYMASSDNFETELLNHQ